MEKVIPPHYCERMKLAVESEDKEILYIDEYREYGIPVYDGGITYSHSYIVIKFCPFCGAELPSSLRETWFETLEKEGIELRNPDDIPKHMCDGSWWRKAAL